MKKHEMLTEAAFVISDGANVEYDRAIFEITTSMLGGTSDDIDFTSHVIRSMNKNPLISPIEMVKLLEAFYNQHPNRKECQL